MPKPVLRFDLVAKKISTLIHTSEAGAANVVTSRPYPVEVVERMDASLALIFGRLWSPVWSDEIDPSLTLVSGELRVLLQSYAGWPAEPLDVALTLQSGDLRVLLRSYVDGQAEPLDVALTLQSGDLRVMLVSYSNWPAEGVDIGLTFVSGTLT